MKYFFPIFIISLLMLAENCTAQWEKVNGPFSSGSAESIAILDSEIIVGMRGQGIFTSLDNGLTWMQSTEGLQNLNINCLEVIDSNIIAGTQNGIYLSSDNGKSWLTTVGVEEEYIICITVHDSILYAATSNGIFYSTDDGMNWIESSNPSGINSITCFANDDSAMYTGTLNGLFRSTDNGITWEGVNNPPSYQISTLAIWGNKMFAGVYGGLYVSTDDGNSWTSSDNGLMKGDITCITNDSSFMYVGTSEGGVYVSKDSGSNWVQTSLYLNNPNVSSLIIKDSSIYACTGFGGGVYKSTDRGMSWTRINMSKRNLSMLSLSIHDSTLIAGTDSAGVFLSTDGGKSWSQHVNGLQSSSINCFLTYKSKIYLGSNNGACISSDGGKNWNYFGLGSYNVQCFLIQEPYLYVGMKDGLSSTLVSSTGWGYAAYGINSPNIKAIAANNEYIFAGTWGDGVYRSSDNGTSWTQVTKGFANLGVSSLLFDENSLFAGTLEGGILATDNNGGTWTQKNTGLGNVHIHSLLMVNPYIFAATNGGIYATASNGLSWTYAGLNSESINSLQSDSSALYVQTTAGIFRRPLSELAKLFPPVPVLISPRLDSTVIADSVILGWNSTNKSVSYMLQLSFDKNFSSYILDTASIADTTFKAGKLISDTAYYWRIRAYDSKSIGIWSNVGMFKTGKITALGKSAYLPKEYMLYQNFPNPFNPTTAINYEIPTSGLVTIKIYDVLGREIETLVNKEKSPGKYKVEFDGSNFASGLYFYRITSNNFSQTKKMLLIK